MNEIIREVVIYITFGQLVIQVWGGSLYIETDYRRKHTITKHISYFFFFFFFFNSPLFILTLQLK